MKEQQQIWNYINKEIERSKIPRLDSLYKAIFGHSLTQEIVTCINKSMTKQQTLLYLLNHLNPYLSDKGKKNVKTNVYARYGEHITHLRTNKNS